MTDTVTLIIVDLFRVFETEDSLVLMEEGSSMSTILERDTPTYRSYVNLQFGLPYTYLMLAHTWKLPEKKRKFRVALKVLTLHRDYERLCCISWGRSELCWSTVVRRE